jgi:hypothetical protein
MAHLSYVCSDGGFWRACYRRLELVPSRPEGRLVDYCDVSHDGGYALRHVHSSGVQVIVSILQFIGGLFALAGKIFDYLNQKQMVDLAKTAQQLDSLKAQVDAAHQSVKIREAVVAALERDPSSVMSDDGFQRPD